MDDSMSSGLGGRGCANRTLPEARAGRSSTIFFSKEIFSQLQRHDVCNCSWGEQVVELAGLGLGLATFDFPMKKPSSLRSGKFV
jgi:hypothetical protein